MPQMPEYDESRVLGFRPFSLVCECGCVPSQFKSVGLTPERELVVHWICRGCHQPVYFVKSLPRPARAPRKKAATPEGAPASGTLRLRPEDLAFLRSIRVTVPDDAL